MTAEDGVSTLAYLFEIRGEPEHIRSNNGPEFIAEAVQGRLARTKAGTPDIEPGSPWEDAQSETFNSRLRGEVLDREVFAVLKEPKALLEDNRLEYNHRRPHSSLGYRTQAEFAASCHRPDSASLHSAGARSIPEPVLS